MHSRRDLHDGSGDDGVAPRLRIIAAGRLPGGAALVILDDLANGERELVAGHRLQEYLADAGREDLLARKGFTEPGAEYDGLTRVNLVNVPGEVDAGHLRHDLVRNHEVKAIRTSTVQPQGFLALIGQDGLVAKRCEDMGLKLNNFQFVIDEQDAALAVWYFRGEFFGCSRR